MAASGPTVILMAGLQGSGKTTACAKLAQYFKKQRKDVALAACDVYRPAAVEQLVTMGQRAGAHVYEKGTDADPVDIATWALDRAREERRDVLDHRHRRPPPHRPGPDEGAVADPRQDEARRRAAGGRRDDRPGRGRGRRIVRRGGRVRRRRDDQARRRRPRRRRALGQGGHRQADHVRLDRRENRGLRQVPPGPHGAADPRHGRRAQPDRAGRKPGRREGGRRARRKN